MSKIDKSKKDGVGETDKESRESHLEDLRKRERLLDLRIKELSDFTSLVLRKAVGLPKSAPDHKVDACVRREFGLSEDATEAQLDAKVCKELDLPSGSDPLDVLKAVVKKIDQDVLLASVRDGEKN